MINLDLNLRKTKQKIKIKDEVLFNALLSKNPKLIKKLIKSIRPFYKISDAFFEIVNTFVDFTLDGVSIYTGLIVRTGLDDYAVLHLEGVPLDEEMMLKIIDVYIKDTGDHTPIEINVNKFEINRKVFLSIMENI